MGAGYNDVLFRPTTESGAFFQAELSFDFGGSAHNHHSRWKFCPRSDHGTGGNEAFVSDFTTVQQSGAHSDEAGIANETGMNDCAMSDRGEISDFDAKLISEMDDGSVLNIRALSDFDRIDISAQDRAVENAGIFG